MEAPRIASSARKHGVFDETMLHAFNNPILAEDPDEGMTMFVGPDPSGDLCEVGAITGGDAPIIVHAMSVRLKYLR